MSDDLKKALSDPGHHTAESLAARLPDFPVEAVRDALDALTAQGVLERVAGPGGAPAYRYVAPERYAQADLDVVRNPGGPGRPRRR